MIASPPLGDLASCAQVRPDPVTRGAVEQVAELVHDGRDSAGRVEVLHQQLPGRLDVGEHRHLRGDPADAIEVQRHAGAPGEREQVQHRVGRPADGAQQPHRVVKRGEREDARSA